MELLKEAILTRGKVLGEDILKVDTFLNHQIDCELTIEMGKEFAKYFGDKGITRVLTLEVSGIPAAFTTALELGVPMVYAKKIESKNLSEDVYTADVHSFTKGKAYNIRVDKRFIEKGDRVLIIDDFLAKGQALGGLIDLCKQAGAEVGGLGIVIEKAFQNGRDRYVEEGYDIYSLARIEKFEDGRVVFK